MKKILIPIDFSHNSYEAIDYAIKFFKREECDFYFLNTYSYNADGLNALSLLHADEEWFDRPKIASQTSLGALIKRYSYDKNEKHHFNAVSECADIIDAMRKTIEKVEIDMVLIPAKKRDGNTVERYSKNTQRIIESIRACPVMVVPQVTNFKKNQDFILASSFEAALPTKELENWHKLLRLVKGRGKLVVFNKLNTMTGNQKMNLSLVLNRIYDLCGFMLPIEYLGKESDAKQFAKYHSDCILSIVDRKPNVWRKIGLEHSKIVNLGPFHSIPLIALHS